MDLKNIIEESVIESIFERGWVEQSPSQFISQCKNYLKEEFCEFKPNCSDEIIDKMIIDSLMRYLGEEFDLNVFRLQFFPAECCQEFDV